MLGEVSYIARCKHKSNMTAGKWRKKQMGKTSQVVTWYVDLSYYVLLKSLHTIDMNTCEQVTCI